MQSEVKFSQAQVEMLSLKYQALTAAQSAINEWVNYLAKEHEIILNSDWSIAQDLSGFIYTPPKTSEEEK